MFSQKNICYSLFPIRVANMRLTQVLLFTLYNFCFAQEEGEILVETSHGGVKGKVLQSKNGRDYWSFKGIPYAKAPLGELRFSPPQPPDKWEEPREAFEDPEKCLQRSADGPIGSEDCLFLNVYVPQIEEEGVLPPIMIFIHGGFFVTGSSALYPPDYFMDYDVILVTLNYRLDALGFLSTGDTVVPGNNGLRDQLEAIKWIIQNANVFKGNPKNILIFGQSAGAASVHFLTMSPLAAGKFQNAILQSGNAFSHWAFQSREENRKAADKLAELLECPFEESSGMIDCLRNVAAEDIIGAHKDFVEWGDASPQIIFKPVDEDEGPNSFLPDTPQNMLSGGRINAVNFIMGIDKEDGLAMCNHLLGNQALLEELDGDFDRLFPLSVSFGEDALANRTDEIKAFYMGEETTATTDFGNIVNMYTDALFTNPLRDLLDQRSYLAPKKIYIYIFGYRGDQSLADPIIPTKDQGVMHGDELLYMFPMPEFSETPLNDDESEMSQVLLGYWTNFAISGNPNSKENASFPLTEWTPVADDDLQYLSIEGPPQSAVMKDNPWPERFEFWKLIRWNKEDRMLCKFDINKIFQECNWN